MPAIPDKLKRAGKKFRLTERELLAASLLISGKKRDCVAAEMGITARGVQFHLEKIFLKTCTHSTVEALSKLLLA